MVISLLQRSTLQHLVARQHLGRHGAMIGWRGVPAA
jgi:hypothetical protein